MGGKVEREGVHYIIISENRYFFNTGNKQRTHKMVLTVSFIHHFLRFLHLFCFRWSKEFLACEFHPQRNAVPCGLRHWPSPSECGWATADVHVEMFHALVFTPFPEELRE